MTLQSSPELLRAYDEQLRDVTETDPGDTTTDGPVRRKVYPNEGFVGYRSLGGLEGAELDALIERQKEYFTGRGLSFEWKTRGHDLPADLPDRLVAAGFVAEDVETVLVGEARAVAQTLGDPVLPAGTTLRRVTERIDLDGLAAMESSVWGEDWSWLADDLARKVAASPSKVDVYVVEADGAIVSAAWAVYQHGTDFTGLWGGSTLAPWRRKGIYRALVAVRAARAVELGFRYLQVDASDDSSPILQRLGFVPITTTTPYRYTPPTPH